MSKSGLISVSQIGGGDDREDTMISKSHPVYEVRQINILIGGSKGNKELEKVVNALELQWTG